jgi:hypothetical protein
VISESATDVSSQIYDLLNSRLTTRVAGGHSIYFTGGRSDNMVKKVPEQTVKVATKPPKPVKEELQDAARKRLMDLKEC